MGSPSFLLPGGVTQRRWAGGRKREEEKAASPMSDISSSKQLSGYQSSFVTASLAGIFPHHSHL